MDSDKEVVFSTPPKWIRHNGRQMLGCPGLLINNDNLKLRPSKLLNTALKVSSKSLNKIYRDYIYKLNHSSLNYQKNMEKIENRISKEMAHLGNRDLALEGLDKYWREIEYNMEDWRHRPWNDNHLKWLLNNSKNIIWYPYAAFKLIPGLLHQGIITVKAASYFLFYAAPMQFIKGGGLALSANNNRKINHTLKSPLWSEFHPVYIKDKISNTLNEIPYIRHIHKGSNFESLKFSKLDSLPDGLKEFAVINYSVNPTTKAFRQEIGRYKKMHGLPSDLAVIYNLVGDYSTYRVPTIISLDNKLPIQFDMNYYKQIGKNEWAVYKLLRKDVNSAADGGEVIEYNLTLSHNIENVLKINEFGYITKMIEDWQGEDDGVYKFEPHFPNTLKHSYSLNYESRINEVYFGDYDEIDDIFFKGDVNEWGNYLWGDINPNSFNTIIWEDNIYPINYPRSLSMPNYK
jgi:hypothetical protein